MDGLSERRKKLRDERDKLYKMKDELKDGYYGQLINYSKEQFLIRDIDWMTGIKAQVVEREERKAKIEAERKERAERRKREIEERERLKQERIKKEEERK